MNESPGTPMSDRNFAVETTPAGDVVASVPTWRRPTAWLLDGMVAGYQRLLSPRLPPACRFEPTCSVYARGALAQHIVARALLLIGWRLLRCQPLCAGGFDPVPPGRYTPSERAPARQTKS